MVAQDAKKRWLAFGARLLASLSSGFLLAGAFPPSEQKEAAWLALVPLMILARYTSPGRSFRWGWLSGMFFWLLTLTWLLRLAGTGANWPVAILAWAALSAALAVYRGVFCMTISWLLQRWRPVSEPVNDGEVALPPPPMPRSRSLVLVFLVPALWVGVEYWRAILFSGFPWNLVGVSQFRVLPLLQVAEWGGVYAVSYVVVTLNAAVALMLIRFVDRARQPVRRRDVQVELMLGLLVVAVCFSGGVARMRHWHRQSLQQDAERVKVVAIQPNIKQPKKWDRAAALANLDVLYRLTSLFEGGTNGPDVIIWPETAVPGFAAEDTGSGELVRVLLRRGVPLLVGTLEREIVNGEELLYNSSLLFGVNGRVLERYRKQHLVPFGEYFPLENVIPFFSRFAPMGFSCSAGEDAVIFRLPGRDDAPFSTLICFEDVMPYLARRAVRKGARWLVVQTNDAWFDPSSGSLQHMSQCVLRAVENRVPIVRVANTGVTAYLSPLGGFDDNIFSGGRRTMYEATHPEEVRVPRGEVPLTFYARFGDLSFALPCAILLLLVWGAALVDLRRLKSRIRPEINDNSAGV